MLLSGSLAWAEVSAPERNRLQYLCNKYRVPQNNRITSVSAKNENRVLCVLCAFGCRIVCVRVCVFLFAVDIYNVKRNTREAEKKRIEEKNGKNSTGKIYKHIHKVIKWLSRLNAERSRQREFLCRSKNSTEENKR